MSYLVVACPGLSAGDTAWIEDLRARFNGDVQGLISPHFTLVFAVSEIAETALLSHVASVAGQVAAINMQASAALMIKDNFGPDSFVYLVPDQGLSRLVHLHDLLYTGPLDIHLRLDIAYIPHITLARFADPRLAKALVDDINGQDRQVLGTVDEIIVHRHDGDRIETIAAFALTA